MKTTKFKALFSLLLLSAFAVSALGEEVTKKLKHEFTIDNTSVLVLQNKYGRIDVQNWNENKAVIEVEILVKHPDRDRAQKLIEYIDVDFSTSGSQCKAVTIIDDKFNKLKGNNWGNGKKFSINYTVKIPEYLNLDLHNKYGDVFIDKLTGHANINVKYGNLQANSISRGNIKPLSSLTLGYGKAEIEELAWMKVDIKYSKLYLDKGKALVLQSKYSKLYIGEVSSIVAESKYDNYEINKIQNFVINGAYSDYSIDYLGKKLLLDTKYSGTTIEKIPASFELIKITNSYGGIKLGIADDASYRLNGESKYSSITYPQSSRMSRIEKSNYSTYEGIVGNSSDPEASVSITTSYGGVRLNL